MTPNFRIKFSLTVFPLTKTSKTRTFSLQVVGRVGSGKSSLLHALLGEMDAESGMVRRGGTLAYAAQTPWIVNATVLDNICMGMEYDTSRWLDVVHACALATDLTQWPRGELTEIGENGVNLSGGQKQRVQLARAAYQVRGGCCGRRRAFVFC